MKKLFYLFLTGTLLMLPFTSCNDDDDKPITIPSDIVTNLSFTDTDYEKGKIGGKLTWTLPTSEDGITGYVIYMSNSATDKGGSIDEVKAGVSDYTIVDGTEFKEYIHVVAKNSVGESERMASLNIRDNTSPVVEGLSFEDKDNAPKLISGQLTWKVPGKMDIGSFITGYVIYASDKNHEKGEIIATLDADKTSFTIEEGTAYIPYLQVSIISDGEVLEDFASISVADVFELNASFYILNRGNFKANNSTLGFYDHTKKAYTKDLFGDVNGQGIGDSAQEMLIYGEKIYITVYGSNALLVTDLNGKLLKEIKYGEDEPLNPRGMASYDGKVYVSFYKGHSVAALDTLSFEFGKSIQVGRYPEQLAVANKKLYVANSGGMDHPDYGKTVSVIDLEAEKVTEVIDVLDNPTLIEADSKGNIFVLSMGNYEDIPNTLQRIDAATGEVKVLGLATIFSLANDEIYAVDAPWGADSYNFVKYNTLTGEEISPSFIRNYSYPSPSSIDVDPKTGQIYISNYDYSMTSDIYIFDANGTVQSSFDTYGYSTIKVWFK